MTIKLVLGAALCQVAAGLPVVWGMILGSGVGLGGDIGRRWLMNISEGLFALGVVVGGRLVESERASATGVAATAALGVGLLVGWLGMESPAAVLIGLGLFASLGAGMLLSLAAVVVLMRVRMMLGTLFGLTLCGGLIGSELLWGSASILSLARGSEWVIGQATWIGPLTAAVGAGLIAAGLGAGERYRSRRTSCSEEEPKTGGARAVGGFTFVVLAALAFSGALAGLLSQRAAAALSLVGVPEDSFTSGVLVGFTFAVCYAAGNLLGGVVHDVLGPKKGVIAVSSGLATSLAVLSGFSGYENPWHILLGTIGIICGMANSLSSLACVRMIGRRHIGYLFGYLYLSVAVGKVLVIPTAEVVDETPAFALVLVAVLCVVLAISAFRISGRRHGGNAREGREGR